MENQKKVVAVLNDLMFQVKIQDAARKAGLEMAFVKSQSQALEIAGQQPAMIILDLNYSAASPLETIEKLKGDEKTKNVSLVGYVSHVQVELKQAAQQKGCDVVIARSAFTQNLPEILARYTGGNPPSATPDT